MIKNPKSKLLGLFLFFGACYYIYSKLAPPEVVMLTFAASMFCFMFFEDAK